MVQAVLAIEDRRFYYHPGVDPIRIIGAVVTNLRGDAAVPGRRQHDHAAARQELLPDDPTKTLTRGSCVEQFMALILERKASEGRDPRAVSERRLSRPARLVRHPRRRRSGAAFFGKDVSNLTLTEAATIAGVIQSPSTSRRFDNPERCRERRNVVLQAMADAEFITPDAGTRARRANRFEVVQRALDNEAPYFVDYVGQALERAVPGR